MSRLRTAAVAALTATALATAPALATGSVYCHIVVDAVADESLVPGGPHVADLPNVDVLSADVAADAKRMTVVVRVRSITTPFAATYRADLTVGGVAYVYVAQLHPDTNSAALLASDGTVLATASLVVDAVRAEVRGTFPLTAMGSPASGTPVTLDQVTASLSPGLDAASVPVTADVATGPGYYVLAAPSCVRVGA